MSITRTHVRGRGPGRVAIAVTDPPDDPSVWQVTADGWRPQSLREAIAEGAISPCSGCGFRLEEHVPCGLCSRCCPCGGST